MGGCGLGGSLAKNRVYDFAHHYNYNHNYHRSDNITMAQEKRPHPLLNDDDDGNGDADPLLDDDDDDDDDDDVIVIDGGDDDDNYDYNYGKRNNIAILHGKDKPV